MPTPPGGRPPGHVTCDACWEANTPPDGQADTCEDITLPQTSFAGGKDLRVQDCHYTFIETCIKRPLIWLPVE